MSMLFLFLLISLFIFAQIYYLPAVLALFLLKSLLLIDAIADKVCAIYTTFIVVRRCCSKKKHYNRFVKPIKTINKKDDAILYRYCEKILNHLDKAWTIKFKKLAKNVYKFIDFLFKSNLSEQIK